MAERFPIYHADIADPGTTTQEAYNAVWFEKGWRKTKPKTSSSSVEETNNQADDTADSQED